MIDPATAQLLIKLTDVAIVGVMTWQRARDAEDDLDPGLVELQTLKRQIQAGTITLEEAQAQGDLVVELLMKPLDEAIARL